VCSEFPLLIDRTFVTKAEHHFIFQLRRPDDVERMARWPE
jgi:hypothetical protein